MYYICTQHNSEATVYFLLPLKALIGEPSLHLWKVKEEFLSQVTPKTLKWVNNTSSMTFHINGKNNDTSAFFLFTVMEWGVMSCVCIL